MHLLKEALIKQKKKFAGGRKNVSQRGGAVCSALYLKKPSFLKKKKGKNGGNQRKFKKTIIFEKGKTFCLAYFSNLNSSQIEKSYSVLKTSSKRGGKG